MKCHFMRWHALICRSPQIGWCLDKIHKFNSILVKSPLKYPNFSSPSPLFSLLPLPRFHCKWTATPWSLGGGGQVTNCIRHSNVRASALLCSYCCTQVLYYMPLESTCILTKSSLVVCFISLLWFCFFVKIGLVCIILVHGLLLLYWINFWPLQCTDINLIK